MSSLTSVLRRPTTFLLDIDGTLVFTDDLYYKVFQKLLTPLGYTVDEAFYSKNVHGKVDREVFGNLMPAGTSEEELLKMSKKKDACFCELYREHCAKHGPPMLDGLPGMSVRRAGSYFGPHWDAQVTARSAAAAEALVEPLGLLPQNTEHPSYPPGVPLRFGFSTTYPQVAQAMGGPAGFL